jgi:small-conductance mechanosensitive channel
MEILEFIKNILSFELIKTKEVSISIATICALFLAVIITNLVLRSIRKIATGKLPLEDKPRFISIFQFLQYAIYLIVLLFTLNASGVDITVFLTASAALFIGIGFALQQFFKDLLSGILIILDQSLKVKDVIEIEGKICKVEKISLRYTKAITRNETVMIIPNHVFLSNILYNFTQNGNVVRESLELGVAYHSDTKLVSEILLKVTSNHPEVLKEPAPFVSFLNFGESSLDFAVFFYVNEIFTVDGIKSQLRFAINEEFKRHHISIPFPQRDVHFYRLPETQK